MATNLMSTGERVEAKNAQGVVVLLARFLFASIFIMSSYGHFSGNEVNFAASQGVPLAQILVPISGILALAGGLSVLLGYQAKIGAWLIVLFLIPVTFFMHRFWGIADAQAAQMQMINFMKNMSILGGALIITQFGAGPASIDARRNR